VIGEQVNCLICSWIWNFMKKINSEVLGSVILIRSRVKQDHKTQLDKMSNIVYWCCQAIQLKRWSNQFQANKSSEVIISWQIYQWKVDLKGTHNNFECYPYKFDKIENQHLVVS
jgi:hypothetical protein